ncbi:MAG: hypothetical protein N3A38_09880, partial [Planctomycetota bacterium]|nr:hypothetical protein [Planctomycetota bacterium]
MGLPGFGGNERIGERSRQGPIPVPSRMNLRARPWHEGLAGSILRIAVCLAIVGTGISMFASYGGGRKRSAEMPAGGGCPLVCLPGSVPQPPGKADPCPQKVVRIDASDLARLASVNVEDARDAGSASADGTVGDATTPETGSAGAGTAPGCGSTAGACGGTERPGDARASGQSPPGKADAAAPASGRSSPGRGSGEDGPIGAEATPAAEDENREANGESRPATKEEAKGTAAGESKGPGKGVAGSGSESAVGREEGEGGGKPGRRKGREEAASGEKYSWTREEWEKMKFLPPSEKFEPLKEDLDPDDDDFALIWDTDLE